MGLRRIVLRDFVLVHQLDLDFEAGFTVLTGETGAGKSILIDALQFVLGERADTAVLREGAARTEASAEFDSPDGLATWLDDCGFTPEPTLLLRRSLDAQGRSRAWINGSPATASQLREVAARLVDIHGQHAWQSLTRPAAVRQLLDRYAAADTGEVAAAWARWREALHNLHEAQQAQATLAQERERLAWQIGELDKLAPAAGEWADLGAEHARLANAQTLIEAAGRALALLHDDEAGASGALGRAQAALQAPSRHEPAFAALAEQLGSAMAQVDDAAHSLNAWLRRTEPDPSRLAALDERMGQWLSLSRRFRRPPEELPALLTEWREALSRLDAAADLEALAHAEQTHRKAYDAAARALSRLRQAGARKLSAAVTAAMQGLGMTGGRFDVSVEPAEPGPSGADGVGFLVAGHAGSTPRPVGKVASGGELSRIALAIAVTTSELGDAPTLIFDEIDSGIGGAVADTVGRLMKQLGRDRQVLAVTHLPQVAACADRHLVVEKHAQGDGPRSEVRPVQGEPRVAEIARMLGGGHLAGTSLAHAKELLVSATGADRGR